LRPPASGKTDRNAHRLTRYLDRHVLKGPWTLACGDRVGIDQIIVIPAYAERDHLFDTLAALAGNPPPLLSSTLVIVVVNNGPEQGTPRADFLDNQRTLQLLKGVQTGSVPAAEPGEERLRTILETLRRSALRLGVVDAASPGREFPRNVAGVGAARKLGLDLALSLPPGEGGDRVLICLDADTRVPADYLEGIRRRFRRRDTAAGIVSFAHPPPEEIETRAAILCYEIFLRYYVLALLLAGSPYAFPCVGSTMVFKPDRYVSVRGMSLRTAGEDFYFLNKVRKAGIIEPLHDIVVQPAARLSARVPFGTGRRLIRHLNGERDEYLLYHPGIFAILRSWLDCMEAAWDEPASRMLQAAARIHPALRAFLELQGFGDVWTRLRQNTRDMRTRHVACHTWFDGFRTLKLVHHLSAAAYPLQPMSAALTWLLTSLGQADLPGKPDRFEKDTEAQAEVLTRLRGYPLPPARRRHF